MDLWHYVQSHDYSSPENQIRLLVEEYCRLEKPNKQNKLLDIGGGLRNRKEFLKNLGQITTIDIEKQAGVDIVADAHKLPFPDKSFNTVTLFMVLEHLEDPKKAISEISRILRPHGFLLLTTVQYWHNHPCPNDYYRFTDAGLKYLCQVNSLKVVKIWSHGGPFLLVFHAIELNLLEILRKVFLLTVPLFNWLDKRSKNDSLGWSLIARK